MLDMESSLKFSPPASHLSTICTGNRYHPKLQTQTHYSSCSWSLGGFPLSLDSSSHSTKILKAEHKVGFHRTFSSQLHSWLCVKPVPVTQGYGSPLLWNIHAAFSLGLFCPSSPFCLCFHNPHFKSRIRYLWKALLIRLVKLNCAVLYSPSEFVYTFVIAQITA